MIKNGNKRMKAMVMLCLCAAMILTVFAACNHALEENPDLDINTTPSATVGETPSLSASEILNTPEPSAPPSDTVTAPGTNSGAAIPSDSAVNPTATQTTETGEPSATATSTSKPTATKAPTTTAKLTTAKPTSKTTKTTTPKPTATAKPTATTTKEVYQTLEFEGKTYKVLMGRNGNPYLIKDYSTLPKVLQAYAYPTLDMDAIRKDLYLYAKSVGFTVLGNPVGMTKELADTECSWNSPHLWNYYGDSAFTVEDGFSEVDDIVGWRDSFQSAITRLAEKGKTYLTIWFEDCGDSSYRKTYFDNGLYNSKVTKEYAVYFMYGWGDGVEEYVF